MALLTSLRAGNLLILAGLEGARRRSAAYSLASTRFGDGACAPATRERSICSAPLILRCRCGEIIWRERSARLRKALPGQNSNWARTIRRCGRRSAGEAAAGGAGACILLDSIVPSEFVERRTTRFGVLEDRGRVAQPFGFALTDPGVRLSRTRPFPRVTRVISAPAPKCE